MMARGMDLIFLQASPMLWLFEREPLNLISFAFHLNHHQSEIIIDFLRTNFDDLRRRHKPFLRADHGALPFEACGDQDPGFVLPLHGHWKHSGNLL